VGGGTLPTARLGSVALALRPPSGDPNALAARLRRGRPAIVGRVAADELWLDLRTIGTQHDDAIAEALARAAG